MKAKIEIPEEALREFCRRWKIVELGLFGSVLREDFRPESDVDVLVSFEAGKRWEFAHLAQMRRELETLLARKVDLVEKDLVEQSENYIRRKHILRTAEPIYVA